MDENLEQRMQVIERLTQLFKFERLVYLSVTGVSLVLLVACAISLLIRDEAGTAELSGLFGSSGLSGLFGSSGLITYTAGRLLYMWSEAINRLIPAVATKGSEYTWILLMHSLRDVPGVQAGSPC